MSSFISGMFTTKKQKVEALPEAPKKKSKK
jgi:hypothetical protein